MREHGEQGKGEGDSEDEAAVEGAANWGGGVKRGEGCA